MSSESCCSRHSVEHVPDLLVGPDVAGDDEGRADRCGERSDALLDQAFDRGEPDLGALIVEGAGDPPGDRVVVGDAEDERRLAIEQSHLVLRATRRRAAYHRPMTRDGLRQALRGVRGLVLDADGVIVLQGQPLPGSIDAVRRLEDRASRSAS